MISKWLENREEQYLSNQAVKSKNSKGRKKDIEKCKVRTVFQRDRDRIIHSKAYRRLKYKTQVFIAPEGDHYRTRLTHTLEVSQIARTVARALRLNEDLTEAIALGHDLGHTPFGHAGEEAVKEVYSKKFNHNQQSLRVIEELEELNLSNEVKEGIRNHTGEEIPKSKEGQIVRIADRIAYINHDIDDALRAEIIDKNNLPEAAIKKLGKTHSQRIDTMVKDLINFSWNQNKIKRSQEIKEATGKLREFLFEKVYVGSRAKEQEDKAKVLVKNLFNYYLENIEKLPANFKEKINGQNTERIIVDYIAGMSDVYAIDKGKELFIPSPWAKR